MERPHPRLIAWWRDDPADPGRILLNDPNVQRLVAAVSPESHPIDLGGTMSLNVWLDKAGLVLRIHQSFVSRQRLLALQEVRRRLALQHFVVPTPIYWHNLPLLRCRNRWAEVEEYLPHKRLAHSLDAYRWLFQAMGRLHRGFGELDMAIPRPLVATYAPPDSLRRWLSVTEKAVEGDAEAMDVALLLHSLMQQLQHQWTPAKELPGQFVHGDIRLSNVGQDDEGRTVYLDFGFLAHRPRIHELGYSLAFMLLALGAQRTPEAFAWESIPQLVNEYENAANSRLTAAERRALVAYTAAVPLYAAALDGFTEDPVGKLCSRAPFLQLSAWLLAHSTALLS
jgi:Ser/Thr protein kinase RdoA (MazF antagonist)